MKTGWILVDREPMRVRVVPGLTSTRANKHDVLGTRRPAEHIAVYPYGGKPTEARWFPEGGPPNRFYLHETKADAKEHLDQVLASTMGCGKYPAWKGFEKCRRKA